ncbi:hypothetical protein [uncultured Tateyamaria sp.]|uniref:hypothetical protein n=1 Tax=uncultured Tateyamaria sp. TaxID=455651 RepID=UPI0026298A97|nr:hypothetical protein [uncultured Tateyamaria sp.]
MSIVLDPGSAPRVDLLNSTKHNEKNNLDADSDGSKLQLPFTDAKYHVIRKSSQAETTFLAGIFGARASQSFASVVHEVRRYNKIKSTTGETINVGVAVRMIAATSELNLGFELTIPNLAAAGQLNNTEAFAAINVVGFNFSLGDLLVEPGNLDVESFVELEQSFSRLQKFIFSTDAEQHYAPMAIEYVS